MLVQNDDLALTINAGEATIRLQENDNVIVLMKAFALGSLPAGSGKPLARNSPLTKLATNSAMYNFLDEDRDINRGDITVQGISIRDKGQLILDEVIAIASGKREQKRGIWSWRQ